MDGVDNVVTDFYCTLSEGVDYCDQRFFLFLLVSIRNHLSKPHQILCVLPVAMAQSFSGSIAMCYVLLVLQMTCEGRVWYLWLFSYAVEASEKWQGVIK